MEGLILLILSLGFCANAARAQNCYYPDGSLATDASPCQFNDGICCPENWACLSNGLCHLDDQALYGRFSCTAEKWQTGVCPGFCTNNTTASDNEAVLQCDDNTYCCDGDRSSDCCTLTDTALFELPSGRAYAYITKAPEPALSSSSTLSTSLDSAASNLLLGGTTTTPLSIMTDSSPSTVFVSHTVTVVSVLPAPTSSLESSSNNSKHLKRSTVIGLAVGLPLAFLLILAAVLYCCCYGRHDDQRTHPPPPEDDEFPRRSNNPGHAYDPITYAPSELDGNTIHHAPSELDDTSIRQAPSELDASSVRLSYASSLRYPSFRSTLLVDASPNAILYTSASRLSTLTMAAIAMPSVNEEPAELAADEVAQIADPPAEETPEHDDGDGTVIEQSFTATADYNENPTTPVSSRRVPSMASSDTDELIEDRTVTPTPRPRS